MGVAAGEQVGPRPSQRRLLAVLINELTGLGFEPFTDSKGTLRLRNCPYHEMAREDANFVCSLNLALMRGVTEGLELGGISPALEPMEGMCCVAFRSKSETVRSADAGTPT
jgi:predicted ArsR family transcriptional regulator